MDIWFSDLDRKEIYQLPIIPADMPELVKTAKNTEFETFKDGFVNSLGNVSLPTFTIDCFLPEYPNKYDYAKSQINPYLLLNLWSNAMETKTPLRCIMVRGENKNGISPIILNWMVSVESLSWNPMQGQDMKYKADFKEYVYPVSYNARELGQNLASSLNSIFNSLNNLL